MAQPSAKVVLHIDDNPDCLEVVKAVLESEGYRVVQAESGEEGLTAFKQHKPDLVIADLMMEEIDAGVRLVKQIKTLDREVPLYMLSAAGDELNLNVDTTALGITGVFQKPIEPRVLLSTVRARLGAAK